MPAHCMITAPHSSRTHVSCRWSMWSKQQMDTNTAISISGKPLTANHHCVSGAKVMSEAPKTAMGRETGFLSPPTHRKN